LISVVGELQGLAEDGLPELGAVAALPAPTGEDADLSEAGAAI
jgi:hypothetical protein